MFWNPFRFIWIIIKYIKLHLFQWLCTYGYWYIIWKHEEQTYFMIGWFCLVYIIPSIFLVIVYSTSYHRNGTQKHWLEHNLSTTRRRTKHLHMECKPPLRVMRTHMPTKVSIRHHITVEKSNEIQTLLYTP